jgi:hypothetical protein
VQREVVSADDKWIPYGKPVQKGNGKWDKTPANEARAGKLTSLLPFNVERQAEIKEQLLTWWLVARRGANTPNWDIAATCTIQGNPGLLLVEAKAHEKELYEQDKCGSTNPDNLERILQALQGANHNLGVLTENNWSLSRDSHYQLSNRFAWSWKLALLGVPVVLVYLGFLNAQDMTGRELFHSPEDWKRSVHDYGKGVVGDDCWDKRLDLSGVPFFPLIRTYDQPFNP